MKARYKIQLRGIVLPQLVFWTVAYFVLLSLFRGNGPLKMIDHIYTSIFMATLLVAVTLSDWVIIPRYLKQKRYALFFLFTVVNILACTWFNQLFFDKLVDYMLPGYYFISYYEYTDLLRFFVVFVVLSTLLHLSWEWFQFQETRHHMAVLEKEKVNAELKAFTNQVNPHFLFNSLTVLYSLALKRSDDTPGAIIKLSDILRYVIYEASAGTVSLRSEIALINSYIDLQRYRIHPSTRINFGVQVQDEAMRVIPMLFLPLVENSFKHGVKGDVADTYINMVLQAENGVITFNLQNNKSDVVTAEKPAGGIGLKNIAQRLELVYPGRYSFSVRDTQKMFSVNMSITP